MKKLDPKKVEELEKRLRTLFYAADTSIRVFNKELRAADIPADLKKTIEDCFALGLTSAFMLELRIIIMEAKENE